MTQTSATAQQSIVITYPDDAPNRIISTEVPFNWKREVTLSTEQAVTLYNDLRRALFG